uniref:Peptidase C45 hydrolase domain-containing protein n=1 Tax=Populus davidiana TaxID=266767 RepID=A0A6M2F9E6_9ROSI
MGEKMLEMLEIGPCDNPYQMGFLTGQRFSKKIRSRLSSDLVLQNQLLPFAKTPESQALIKALTINNQKKFPKYWDELLGTAEGSGVPVLYMILINFRKEILPFLPKSAAASSNVDTSLYNTPDDCSDVLVVSDTTAIAAHNEDANVALVGHTYIIKATLPNGLSFVGYTYAGELPSCAFGFNSNGLAFTLNSVPPSEAEIVAGGIGRNFISRDLLEATSIGDALSKIQSSEVSVGHSYNLIDVGTRRILNVETASRNRVSVHEVGATPFFHANMYLHLQVEQVDDDNSKGRQERAAVLPKRSKDDFLSLLGDTDHKRYPIYMTGPTLYTLCTAMIDLDDKTLSIIEGNPKNGKVAYIFSMSSKELSHRKINQYY